MYFAYRLTNWNSKVLYAGMTNNFERRLFEHKNGLAEGFTKKYKMHKRISYACTADVRSAIERENRSKDGCAEKRTHLLKPQILRGKIYRAVQWCS